MRKNSKAVVAGKTGFARALSHLQKNVLEFGLFVVELLLKAISKAKAERQKPSSAETPQGI
ncbi:hypothetical protein [Achromobacter sp.]|uniref:hypothetical protein n=1 Tax=Achromobacter sp. TaxID=134375 RepID=UPI0028A89EDF|nr:hypothetical protein [Achromobacter sp.]